MAGLLNLLILVTATCFALAAAAALEWMVLCTALQLMRPAVVRQVTVRPELARGTPQVARAFAVRR
jgi:hypothetical protein